MFTTLEIAMIITPIIAGLIGAGVFPVIIKISYKRKFFKKSNKRTVHGNFVSTLGGIGIFMGLLMGCSIAAFVAQDLGLMTKLYGVIFPLMIVFILGVWDDLQNLKLLEKIFIQFLATAILLLLHPIVITDLDGLFGIGQIPYWLGYLGSFLVVFTLINAVNLLDGIDGFAGLYATLLSFFMVLGGYVMGVFYLQIIGLATMGVLSPFLYYNMFHRRKLFMGDSGSMVLGLLTAFYALSFVHEVQQSSSEITHPYSWLLALTALPLVDLLRVIVIRLSQGRPIFSPDKNHIHHAYLNMGLSHNQTTFIVMELTLSLWLFVYWFEFLPQGWHILVVALLMLGIYLGPILFYKLKQKFFFG
ncbi:undecaprenyl/decaprenyl-phosphate alpha-N-acetylglucosaminyl 1-phosphate transferase [Flavobacteriaceae bacterium]|nr:undecaprenyl/decaprenyl-phosphate alpha-N-acetylglucosaminyl 1-phosphate transferase [Flavobacteriaceae bacterium]